MKYFIFIKWFVVGIIYELRPSVIKQHRRDRWCKALFEFIDNETDNHFYWHKAQWYAEAMGMM